MRLVSWNVNGLKSLLLRESERRDKALSNDNNRKRRRDEAFPWSGAGSVGARARALLDSFDAEIICFQETKVTRERLEQDYVCVEGYDAFFSMCRNRRARGIMGYSGVQGGDLLSQQGALSIESGKIFHPVVETKVTRERLEQDYVCVEGYDAFFSMCRNRRARGIMGYSGVATYCRNKEWRPAKRAKLDTRPAAGAAQHNGPVCTTPFVAEDGLTGLLPQPDKDVASRIDLQPMLQTSLLPIKPYHSPASLDDMRKELTDVDSEGRCVVTDHGAFVLFNLYVPNAHPAHDPRPSQPHRPSLVKKARSTAPHPSSSTSQRGACAYQSGSSSDSEAHPFRRTSSGTSSGGGSSSCSGDSSGTSSSGASSQKAVVDEEERFRFKCRFLEVLEARWKQLRAQGRRVIVVGDMNLIHSQMDSAKRPFTANRLDRRWFAHILHTNHDRSAKPNELTDVFRIFHPKREKAFTCWDTLLNARRSNFGSRIDYVLANSLWFDSDRKDDHEREREPAKDHDQQPAPRVSLSACDILPEVYGSDHCPVMCEITGDIPYADSPPALCGSLSLFRKQRKLSSFFTKSSKAPTDDVMTYSAPTPSSASSNGSKDTHSFSQPHTAPTPTTTSANIKHETTATRSTKLDTRHAPLFQAPSGSRTSKRLPSVKSNAKGRAVRTKSSRKPQGSILSFFSRPTSADLPAATNRSSISHSSARHTARIQSRSANSSPVNSPDGDVRSLARSAAVRTASPPRDALSPLSGRTQPIGLSRPLSVDLTDSNDSTSASFTSGTDGTENGGSATVAVRAETQANAVNSWKKLLGADRSNDAPLCDKHREPTTMFKVNKKGVNQGRHFYVCSRAVGPETDPEAKCDYFKWKSSKRRFGGSAAAAKASSANGLFGSKKSK